MGKRELVLIIAFFVVGAIIYQITAPAPKAGERRFSITQIFRGIKQEMRANASSASVKKEASIALSGSIRELQVTTPRRVPLTIIGEARNDIAYEMPVESTGPDEPTARTWAEKSDVVADERGSILALSLKFPEEGTQSASLTLHVPSKLAVRVESSEHIQVSHVAAVELRNPSGETTISEVGTVTGRHSSGDLSVTGADSVDLTLASSRSKFRGIKHSVSLNARNGECSIAETSAAIDVNVVNVELTVTALKGTVKISGEGGQVKIVNAHKLSIDARRMEVDVDATPASDSEITIVTTDEMLRLTLAPEPSLVLDAATVVGGGIRAGDFQLEATKDQRDSKLRATLGKGGARVLLRNTRGDIVIGQRK